MIETIRQFINKYIPWSNSIGESTLGSIYASIIWLLITISIIALYSRILKKIRNPTFIRWRKILSRNKLNGVYKSVYKYTWSITDTDFEIYRKLYLNDLKTLNGQRKDKDIKDILTLMNSKSQVNINACFVALEQYSGHLFKDKIRTILKLYSRKLQQEVEVYEIIEIICIGDNIYGYTLPNNCPHYRKIRHKGNQQSDILFDEQKAEFRFFGEKLSNPELYIGLWKDPTPNKEAYGSFTFIYPTSTAILKGMWLGEDDKSIEDINSGSWILTKTTYANKKEYLKNKDAICR